MNTILRIGARVHAGLLAESGEFVGSACRYSGVYIGRYEGLLRVDCNQGGIRSFAEAAIHHQDDCPHPRQRGAR